MVWINYSEKCILHLKLEFLKVNRSKFRKGYSKLAFMLQTDILGICYGLCSYRMSTSDL